MSLLHFAKSGFSFTYSSVNEDAALKQNIFVQVCVLPFL